MPDGPSWAAPPWRTLRGPLTVPVKVQYQHFVPLQYSVPDSARWALSLAPIQPVRVPQSRPAPIHRIGPTLRAIAPSHRNHIPICRPYDQKCPPLARLNPGRSPIHRATGLPSPPNTTSNHSHPPAPYPMPTLDPQNEKEKWKMKNKKRMKMKEMKNSLEQIGPDLV